MSTLFNATLQLAQRLKVLQTSTATGGTLTTLLDSKRTESDDTYNGGVAWLITDAVGASAAPEGEWSRISDFANTGGVITSIWTAAPASGDTYGIAVGFPLDMLIGAINDELVRHKVVRYDSTSLDFVAEQSEYDLPVGIRAENLLNVYESQKDDANDNRWVPLNFRVQTAATGTQHVLVVESRGVTVDNDIMLEYTTFLSPLYLPADVIDDSLPLARILDSAAANARTTRALTTGSGSELEMELIKWHREDAKLARAENQIRRPAKRGNVNEAGAGIKQVGGIEHP